MSQDSRCCYCRKLPAIARARTGRESKCVLCRQPLWETTEGVKYRLVAHMNAPRAGLAGRRRLALGAVAGMCIAVGIGWFHSRRLDEVALSPAVEPVVNARAMVAPLSEREPDPVASPVAVKSRIPSHAARVKPPGVLRVVRPVPTLTAVSKPTPRDPDCYLPRSKGAISGMLSRVLPIWHSAIAPAPKPSGINFYDARAEELLRNVPQLDLERLGNKSPKEIMEKAATIEIKTDHAAFIGKLMKERSDLAGLPFLLRGDCALSSYQAKTLAKHSLEIRGQLGKALSVVHSDHFRPSAYDTMSADPAAEFFWSSATKTMSDDWLRPDRIPALQQILLGENRSYRLQLVRRLAAVDHARARAVLVNRVVFDPDAEVRAAALLSLKTWPKEEYRGELLKGLRYPWEPAAVHAALAIADLKLTELAPWTLRCERTHQNQHLADNKAHDQPAPQQAPSRSSFLADLALDPPVSTGDLAGSGCRL